MCSYLDKESHDMPHTFFEICVNHPNVSVLYEESIKTLKSDRLTSAMRVDLDISNFSKPSCHKKYLFLFSFRPAMPSWIRAQRLKFQDLTSLVPFDSYQLFQFPQVLLNSQQLYSYSQQLYSNSQQLYSNSQHLYSNSQ